MTFNLVLVVPYFTNLFRLKIIMKDLKILYLVSDRHDVLAGMVLYMNLLPLNL